MLAQNIMAKTTKAVFKIKPDFTGKVQVGDTYWLSSKKMKMVYNADYLNEKRLVINYLMDSPTQAVTEVGEPEQVLAANSITYTKQVDEDAVFLWVDIKWFKVV